MTKHLTRGESIPRRDRWWVVIRYTESGHTAIWDCWRSDVAEVRLHIKSILRSLGRNEKWRARLVGYISQYAIDSIGRLRGEPLHTEEIKEVITKATKR